MGGEWGWERPLLFLRIYSPGIRTYIRTYFRGQGSLPARACGAIDPCGKATNPPARRMEAAAGDVSGRRVVLSEAAHDLVARRQGIGEPVGLRLAEGGLVRPQDAGGDHTVRRSARSAPVRGSGGGAPVRLLLRQRREAPGVRGGAQPPLASSNVRTLGRLALMP